MKKSNLSQKVVNLDELARRASLQIYPPGVTLLPQGAPVRELYILHSGWVKFVYAATNGRECILGLLTAGAWLGEAAVARDTTATCAVVTVSECLLYRLPLAAYRAWFTTDPEFAWLRQRALGDELTRQMQHAADLVCASARQRLEQALWYMASQLAPAAKDVRLQLPLRHQELAGLIAVTPSHLSRLFNQLEKAGLLQRENGWLRLPTPANLWHVM